MSFASHRSRWLAPLLLAVVFALAPQMARAHGGHDDGAESPGHAAHHAPLAGWSQPCPSGPGNPCCCVNPAACPASAEIPIAICGGWTRELPLPAGQVQWAPVLPLPPSPFALSRVLPRAPPATL